MKLTYILLLHCVSVFMYSQTGINTTVPKSKMDISASNAVTPINTDGFLIPRFDVFPATNPSASQHAMLVFLNNTLTNVNISGTPKDYARGFHFWDSVINDWIEITSSLSDAGGGPWALDGNAVTDTDYLGTNTNHPFKVHLRNAHRFSFTQAGQIIPYMDDKHIWIGLINATYSELSPEQSVIRIGNTIRYQRSYSIAIGKTTEATHDYTIAIGRGSYANRDYSAGFGINANPFQRHSVAFGHNSEAQHEDIAIGGGGAGATGSSDPETGHELRLGYDGRATRSSISIGYGGGNGVFQNNGIGIGYNIDMSGSGEYNSIVLGRTNEYGTNTFKLGNINDLDLNLANLTNPSDGRFKFNVEANVPGLEFIMKLQSVTYTFNYEKYNKFHKQEENFKNGLYAVESGFIAQDVVKTAKNIDYKFDGIIIPKDAENQNYRVAYSKFVVALVKAKQQQQKDLEFLRRGIAELKAMLSAVEAQN